MLRRLVANAGGARPFPLLQADATRLPLADKVFGCALAVHVLHLIPDWRAAVDEAMRVLRPGGVLVAGFPGESRSSRLTRLARRAAVARRGPHGVAAARARPRRSGCPRPGSGRRVPGRTRGRAVTRFANRARGADARPDRRPHRAPALLLDLAVHRGAGARRGRRNPGLGGAEQRRHGRGARGGVRAPLVGLQAAALTVPGSGTRPAALPPGRAYMRGCWCRPGLEPRPR
jgi:SAM-dependent methyltransferase